MQQYYMYCTLWIGHGHSLPCCFATGGLARERRYVCVMFLVLCAASTDVGSAQRESERYAARITCVFCEKPKQ